MFFSAKYSFFSAVAEINPIYNSIHKFCSTLRRLVLIIVCSMFT